MRGGFRINYPSAFLNTLKLSKKHEGDLSQKFPEQTCGYWLITPNQLTLCIENNVLTAGNTKSASGQLQNNPVNGAMLITISCVIRDRDNLGKQGEKPKVLNSTFHIKEHFTQL